MKIGLENTSIRYKDKDTESSPPDIKMYQAALVINEFSTGENGLIINEKQ